MPLLEVDSIRFAYYQNQVLTDVYLKVETGQVIGLLGRNGCGKSTLLKIIFGSLKGESQSVRIDKQYHPHWFATGKVKLLTQQMMLPPYLTPLKGASLFRSNITDLSHHAEFQQHKNQRLGELSGGVRKYLETLVLLHSPCEFLLMDEPFSYIAPVLVEKLIPEIRTVAQQKGILITDHQYTSILEAADKTYLIRDKTLYPISSPDDLVSHGYTM